MAELLVKWYGDTTYDIGDVVVVKENDFGWSKDEDPNTARVKHFIIVKIPEVSVADVLMYLETQYDSDDWSDPDNPPNMLNKRKHKLDTVKLNQPQLDGINAAGGITVTLGQWESFIKDKSV